MVSPAGFRFAGGSCCCCWDYYVMASPSGSQYQQGYRRIKTSGSYPSNKVVIDKKTVAGRPPETASLTINGFRPDLHNKLGFFLGVPFPRPTSRTFSLMRCGLDFSGKERILEYQNSVLPSTTATIQATQLACNWNDRQLIYTKQISATDIPPNSYSATQQIRRVDYDGSNDTLIYEENFTSVGIGSNGIQRIVYEPTKNRVYYTFQIRQDIGGVDSNQWSYVKYVDATTGAGPVTVVTLEDGTVGNKDYFTHGVETSTKNQSLVWVQRYSANNIYEMYRSNFEGGDVALIIAGAAANQQIIGPRYNEREDHLTYERVESAPSTRTAILRVRWDGSGEEYVWHNRQGEWQDGISWSTDPAGHYHACGIEHSGESYKGSG